MKIVIEIEEETYNRIMNGWMPLHKAVNLMENVQKGTPLKEWLSSFNTDSASICFNKIQELKRECERDES